MELVLLCLTTNCIYFLCQMLSTVLNIIMFEDCRNQWSMSRPLLGLILLNEEVLYALHVLEFCMVAVLLILLRFHMGFPQVWEWMAATVLREYGIGLQPTEILQCSPHEVQFCFFLTVKAWIFLCCKWVALKRAGLIRWCHFQVDNLVTNYRVCIFQLFAVIHSM